jgi:hypothetical protein
MRKLMFAGIALMMASAAQAGEPGELACIPQGYTAAQKADIDALLPKVDFLFSSEDDQAMTSLAVIAMASAASCTDKFGWSEAELEPALIHELGRLLETGFRRHGPFTPAQFDKIDATLAKGDRTAVWKALEEQFSKGMDGGDVSVSTANALVLGAFIMETGIGADEKTGELVGVYLAAKVMQRSTARDFAALK